QVKIREISGRLKIFCCFLNNYLHRTYIILLRVKKKASFEKSARVEYVRNWGAFFKSKYCKKSSFVTRHS
ncbi:hypothetical protein, partial [Capnocytophaga genosp. AHN8471]|uniref:hypothetical protein n=1 Tax=Capnocytophaga genosp. AHN8471 TaxID=327574 RepID=UPI001EE3F401